MQSSAGTWWIRTLFSLIIFNVAAKNPVRPSKNTAEGGCGGRNPPLAPLISSGEIQAGFMNSKSVSPYNYNKKEWRAPNYIVLDPPSRSHTSPRRF